MQCAEWHLNGTRVVIGERHDHPALAGLSQIEGVTQEAAVSLTSNHTQPAAGQPFSGRRFVVSTVQTSGKKG